MKEFQHVLTIEKAEKLCPNNCNVVPMRGYARFEDFYLFVPNQGIFFRSANMRRYGEYMIECFIDGNFVGATKIYKREKIKELYEKGLKEEAKEYALGYRLWNETTLGGKKINKYKEAARISHFLCDQTGKEGHDARQYLRRRVLGL